MQQTTNLGLNKPDPNDYADIAKINENMDKIDALVLMAIAAAAAYNPEGSYAVGDYCTHGGKLHKCGTAIPDGEAWTEAHWTTTTVAAELAELSSQLSNTPKTGALANADFNTCITSGMYWFTSANENGPGFNYGQLLVVHGAGDTIAQIAWDYFTNRMVFRTGNPPEIGGSRTWNEWKQIATATPPQEFDLPLASGWSNYSGMRSRYWKKQFDEVSVVVDISNANTVSHGAVVATLPEGFRPAAAFDAPAIIYDGSEIHPVRAYFSTNGQISISGYSNQTWSKVLFFETQASFVASS